MSLMGSSSSRLICLYGHESAANTTTFISLGQRWTDKFMLIFYDALRQKIVVALLYIIQYQGYDPVATRELYYHSITLFCIALFLIQALALFLIPYLN
ncbi:hypothetical protein BDA99DRAFT_179182 [Phascolomyces articulosus]|uniref:Uncharacterized protein n=1 Tax=Phascolomyces articulosus TaxID=60185 RepID=A0AAD5JSH5_9FUNG|nr:hypothetical protein BDA99DRAFT_179182 [Phascolomyces articulosus]